MEKGHFFEKVENTASYRVERKECKYDGQRDI
jgi:hypothetical protein